jgi:pilus assembly protein TadC
LSASLSRLIRINEYKRIQLVSDLQTAGLVITPEQHIANAVIKAVPIGLLALPALYVFPLISPLVLAAAVTLFFREVRSVQAKIREKRDAINFELPRLVSTIDKTLEHNRDVLTMLEGYKSSAAPELRDELSVTVADMRSGNYESALTRLEARVGSSMLSDVTRGLIGVLRGDETRLYWSALSVKFADIQRQMLKQQALKVPGKVKKLSLCLMVCFLLTYLVVITVEVMSSMGAIFG